MSYDGVERAIKSTTLSTVGVDVSPHLFRTAAASTAAMHCGKNLLGAAVSGTLCASCEDVGDDRSGVTLQLLWEEHPAIQPGGSPRERQPPAAPTPKLSGAKVHPPGEVVVPEKFGRRQTHPGQSLPIRYGGHVRFDQQRTWAEL
jgi:hypothetical protein